MASMVRAYRCIHRTSRAKAKVPRLCLFLAASRRRRSVLSSSRLVSRRTERGISKLGEPSRPTPSRTFPSIGTMTLVAEQAVVARLPLGGVGDVVAEEVVRPDRRLGHPKGRARIVGVVDREPVSDHGAAADRAQVGVFVHHPRAEVRPGLLDLVEVVPDVAQVVDDVRSCHRTGR